MKLHELTADVLALQSEDLPEEALADTLEAIGQEFEDGALTLGKLVQNIESDIEELKKFKANIEHKIRVRNNRIEGLKNYLRENMVASGISKIESPILNVTCRKASKVLVIDNEESIPDEYMSVKTVITPDKKAILSALKEGLEVDGCRLADGQSPIVIK